MVLTEATRGLPAERRAQLSGGARDGAAVNHCSETLMSNEVWPSRVNGTEMLVLAAQICATPGPLEGPHMKPLQNWLQ